MIPEAFLKRMEELLGGEYPAFLASLGEASSRALRVNSETVAPDAFASLYGTPLERVPYMPAAYYCPDEKPGRHPYHAAGVYYVQDPGAMASLAGVPSLSGLTCLDLCAAPGGKSTQLAELIGEDGFLLANEIVPARCRILQGNIERLGCKNVAVVNSDSASLAAEYPAFFDFILVDAPCSGEGMFRKYGVAEEEWSEENVSMCADRQTEILEDAVKMLGEGGRILYSTCTFSLEENEKQIDAFLSRHPEFSLSRFAPSVCAVTADGIAFEGAAHPEQLSRARRFYPHLARGEGQFFALLKKEGGKTRKKSTDTARITPEQMRLINDFLKKNLELPSGVTVRLYDGTPYLSRIDFPLPRRRVFSPGVILGSFERGRIEPHHQLFSAYGNCFKRKLNLTKDDPRVEKYLAGETLSVDGIKNGYAAVLLDGVPLGGVKIVDGVAKNHYPRGLRIR